MAITPDVIAAIARTLKGARIKNERKELENHGPGDLRDLFILACEAADPTAVQAKVLMRPTRVKL